MATYQISPRGESSFDLFTVEAESYQAAAQKAAYTLHQGRGKPTVHARRVTGENGKSGFFHAYVNIGGGEHRESSLGGPFHVMCLD